MKNSSSFSRRSKVVVLFACILAGIQTAGEPIAQGGDTVQTSSRPPRGESKIRKFEAIDALQPPPQGAVLLIGDSIAQGWTDVEDYFPECRIINRGIGGVRFCDVLRFVDRIVLPYGPTTILVSAGGNDLQAGTPPEQIRNTARAFIDKVHATLPDARIYFLGMPLVRRAFSEPLVRAVICATNAQLAELADTEENVEFIDSAPAFLDGQGKFQPDLFVEDGIHLSPRGYAVVAKLLRGKF